MGKLSLDDLKKLRDEKKKTMEGRDTNKDVKIIIGMGTCGIAAGAKETFDSFVEELGKKDTDAAIIKQTGCMGLCYSEPTVEIQVPGMPSVVYGDVDPETAKKIVNDHIMEQKLVDDHIYDKPSTDILSSKTE